MGEDWLTRWRDGNIGWHEPDGNLSLSKYWPTISAGSRVLVPLCGKSPDLLWLGERGYEVTGVELSEIAVQAFFEESRLRFNTSKEGELIRFQCVDPAITIFCGDYFQFDGGRFDALYDRASLIALPPENRQAYIRHTQARLQTGAAQLLITLEYDQARAPGPPYSVLADEVRRYWKQLQVVSRHNVIDTTPPKFRNAGLTEVTEVVWTA